MLFVGWDNEQNTQKEYAHSLHSESVIPFPVKGRNEKFCQIEYFEADLLISQRPVICALDLCGWVKNK